MKTFTEILEEVKWNYSRATEVEKLVIDAILGTLYVSLELGITNEMKETLRPFANNILIQMEGRN